MILKSTDIQFDKQCFPYFHKNKDDVIIILNVKKEELLNFINTLNIDPNNDGFTEFRYFIKSVL